MISPTILPEDLNDPSHSVLGSGRGGGITWAIGSPLRVTRIGFPVFFTLSSTARQVALKVEMGMLSSIGKTSFIFWGYLNFDGPVKSHYDGFVKSSQARRASRGE
jgi:hypothetical protein